MRMILLAAIAAGVCLAQEAPRGPGWVVLPVSEYAALRAKAYPIDKEAEPLRVEATLTRVDYDLRVEGEVATGQATLTIDVLKDGWVRAPLPGGLLVSGAKLDGKPVALVPSGGQIAAVFARHGRATLTLDVALPVTRGPGEQRLSAPSGGAAITRATVTVPAEDIEVAIAGGVVSRATARNWVAYARGSDPLVFTMRRKQPETPRVELPLRARGSLTQLFGLGEDSTSINAEVEIEVVQGAARQARIAIPDGVAINHVPGGDVAEWDVEGGALVVKFLEPVERSAKFGVIGEVRLPRDGAIAIPLLRLLDVEREPGAAAVEVVGAGEIKRVQPEGLDPADASDLGPMLAARQSPALTAFRSAPGAASKLTLEIARYTQQAVLTANIEEARHRMLLTRDGKTLVQARYAVRNNQRNFLRVALPAGSVLWSAAVAGRPIRPGKAADGSLLLPLLKARAGEDAPPFAVELVYLAAGAPWTDKGRAPLLLPTADLQISRTGVTAHYPPVFRVTADAGTLRTRDYEPPQAAILADTAPPPQTTLDAPPGVRAARTPAERLAQSYRPRSSARSAGALMPAGLSFPEVGPSLYLACELTQQNQAPTVELAYQKDKQGGTR